MSDELLQAWRINHKINLFLIDRITDEGMACTTSTRGGRDVLGQWVHVHNVRWAWLNQGAPDLARGVKKLDTKKAVTREQLKASLEASADAVGSWIARSAEQGTSMRRMGGSAGAALGYFLAHDSHHRGNIALTLKLCGHKLAADAAYGIWGLWHKKL